MRYIENPNLPQNTVKKLILSQETPAEIVSELTRGGIEVLFTPKNPYIEEPVAAHTDVNLLHLRENMFICTSEMKKHYRDLLNESNILSLQGKIKSPYPNDVGLNVCFVGKYAVFNPKTINEQVFEYIESAELIQIHVKQGYTKCNIVPIATDAIITEDEGIYRAVQKHMDVLCVPIGTIQLYGYKHGFIGGACGKLSKDILAITGNLKYVNANRNIIQFCKNYGVSVLELSNRRPIDVGSLIPIVEV